MRKTRLTPLGTNTFAVRVDSYVDGEMKGVFSVPGSAAPVKFSSLPGLILMIEDILDAEEAEETAWERPPTVTFEPNVELEVLFRQNHSWQGRIKWLEEGKETTFRSVLELLIAIETIFGV